MISLLDTNVLIRFLVGDDESQKKQAIKWFKEATEKKREIVVKPMVVAETIFILESFYKHPREKIMSVMLPFLALPVLDVRERDALLHLWGDYLDGLHFVDAYLLACARVENGDILSFDKKLLDRLSVWKLEVRGERLDRESNF